MHPADLPRLLKVAGMLAVVFGLIAFSLGLHLTGRESISVGIRHLIANYPTFRRWWLVLFLTFFAGLYVDWFGLTVPPRP